MKKLIELTSWEIIPPKPYGIFHLSFFVIGMIICIYFAKRLRGVNDNKNKKIRNK